MRQTLARKHLRWMILASFVFSVTACAGAGGSDEPGTDLKDSIADNLDIAIADSVADNLDIGITDSVADNLADGPVELDVDLLADDDSGTVDLSGDVTVPSFTSLLLNEEGLLDQDVTVKSDDGATLFFAAGTQLADMEGDAQGNPLTLVIQTPQPLYPSQVDGKTVVHQVQVILEDDSGAEIPSWFGATLGIDPLDDDYAIVPATLRLPVPEALPGRTVEVFLRLGSVEEMDLPASPSTTEEGEWSFLGLALVEDDGLASVEISRAGVYAVALPMDRAQENRATEYLLSLGSAKAFYQARVTETSTHSLLAAFSWNPEASAESKGAWQQQGSVDEPFFGRLLDNDTAVDIRSAFANMGSLTVTYLDNETYSSEPLMPFILDEEGNPGDQLQEPYDDCQLSFAGAVHLDVALPCYATVTSIGKVLTQPLRLRYGNFNVLMDRITVKDGVRIASLRVYTNACSREVLEATRLDEAYPEEGSGGVQSKLTGRQILAAGRCSETFGCGTDGCQVCCHNSGVWQTLSTLECADNWGTPEALDLCKPGCCLQNSILEPSTEGACLASDANATFIADIEDCSTLTCCKTADGWRLALPDDCVEGDELRFPGQACSGLVCCPLPGSVPGLTRVLPSSFCCGSEHLSWPEHGPEACENLVCCVTEEPFFGDSIPDSACTEGTVLPASDPTCSIAAPLLEQQELYPRYWGALNDTGDYVYLFKGESSELEPVMNGEIATDWDVGNAEIYWAAGDVPVSEGTFGSPTPNGCPDSFDAAYCETQDAAHKSVDGWWSGVPYGRIAINGTFSATAASLEATLNQYVDGTSYLPDEILWTGSIAAVLNRVFRVTVQYDSYDGTCGGPVTIEYGSPGVRCTSSTGVDSCDVFAGSSVTVNVAPAEGKQFVFWLDKQFGTVHGQNPYTISALEHDLELTPYCFPLPD